MKTTTSDVAPVASRRLPDNAPGFWSVVRKSALLNLVIVATSFPALVSAGGPLAVGPVLLLLSVISAVLWALTFALFSFASLFRLFQTPSRKHPLPIPRGGDLRDPWLDDAG